MVTCLAGLVQFRQQVSHTTISIACVPCRMADARIHSASLHLDDCFEVLGTIVRQQSQTVLPKHILPAVLHVLWRHLPFLALHVVMAFLESSVRVTDIVRRKNQARRITAEVYGHVVLLIEPVKPSTQALTATAAAGDAVPAEAVFLDGNFDAVEISGHFPAGPYSDYLLAPARIVVCIIFRRRNQFLHSLSLSLMGNHRRQNSFSSSLA